jgi:hypothetical protein
MAVGPRPIVNSATVESGTAAPDAVATLSCFSNSTSPRAERCSTTRTGIRRSPALNLARLASTSPRVATRIVSDSASVDTPRSAASPVRGVICSSGRSRSAVEEGFARIGTRRISLASWFAVSLMAAMSLPAMMSCRSRCPFSFRNQKRISGTDATRSARTTCRSFCEMLRSLLWLKLMTRVALRISAAPPRIWPP